MARALGRAWRLLRAVWSAAWATNEGLEELRVEVWRRGGGWG